MRTFTLFLKTKLRFLAMLMLAIAMPVGAQVTFILDTIPDYTPADAQIYINSGLNGFTHGDPEYALHKNQAGKWEITIQPSTLWSGFYYYFTRGTMKTRETDSLEFIIYNRGLYTFSTPDTVRIRVYNWYDHEGKPTTAAWNVTRMSENFPMPQLGRTRGISIYLPPDYNVSEKSYPVIYMHDGQAVFDRYSTLDHAWGEWNVDETLNEMASEGIEVPIVVAIDYGYERFSRETEYAPCSWYYSGQNHVGEGEQYIDFLTNTLKPYIDSTYRTLTGPESTCIMGSSLGGLISFYGAIRRPDIFRKAGLFSPSYHVWDNVWIFLRDAEKVHPMRMYQMVGSTEQEEGGDEFSMIDNVEGMHGMLSDMGFTEEEIKYEIVENGEHHRFLRYEFRQAYLWLFPGASSSARNEPVLTGLVVFPNPAGNTLYINTPLPADNSEVQIYTLTGSLVCPARRLSGNSLDISTLPGGYYILKIVGQKLNYTGRFIKK